MLNVKSSICKAFDEDGYFKPIVDRIKPADPSKPNFPKKCPIPTVINFLKNIILC